MITYLLAPGVFDSGSGIESVDVMTVGPDSARYEDVADDLARVAASRWNLLLTFTSEGAVAFDDMAARALGSQLAIEYDGVVLAAPTIQSADFGGQAAITGGS